MGGGLEVDGGVACWMVLLLFCVLVYALSLLLL